MRAKLEIFGTLVVVLSLLLLVFELRETRLAMESETYQERAFQSIDQDLQKLGNPAIVAHEFNKPYSELTDKEGLIRRVLLGIEMRDLDNDHYQYENGFLDADFYQHTTVVMIGKLAPKWREAGLRAGRKSFRKEVDRILAERPDT